jgi:myo-inositol-1(or 4)-monophosphatase
MDQNKIMHPSLSYIESLATQAGEMLRSAFGSYMKVDRKGAIDLVTEMDFLSENLILGQIQKDFPGHNIISEESGDLMNGGDEQWFVDPLDGTVNYAHGVPIFCVSIAYAVDGFVKLGVVYDPMQNECYGAELGKGAWLNGQPIKVSNTPNMDSSLLVTGFPYDIRTHPENNLDLYARFTLSSQGVRRFGSAALDLCFIARGQVDGYWEIRIHPWDTAAGGLIAQEAGALVTKIYGERDYLKPPYSILAANPNVYPEMLEVFREYRRERNLD